MVVVRIFYLYGNGHYVRKKARLNFKRAFIYGRNFLFVAE